MPQSQEHHAAEEPLHKAIWDEVTFNDINNSKPRMYRQIPAPCLPTFAAIWIQLEEQFAAGVDPASSEALKRLNALQKMVLIKPKRTGRHFRGYMAKLWHLWGHVRDSVDDKNRALQKHGSRTLAEIRSFDATLFPAAK